MAELARCSIALDLDAADPAIAVDGFAVRVLDPAALWMIRSTDGLAANAAEAGDPCRLWLAPDRVLLACDAPCAPPPAAFATEVTDGFAVFALSGGRLSDMLASGCTLDPDSPALAVGRCAQTLFGGVRVLLQPRADAWRMYVERPLAAFVLDWLRQAASALDSQPRD